jgi:23S rRNA (uracil1939-C5)-methyltransferase
MLPALAGFAGGPRSPSAQSCVVHRNLGGVPTAVRLTPTAVAAGGDAIARDEHGRVVFVNGALPGETVQAEIVEERADFARARVVEVVEPSPGRRVPPCPSVAAGCGGCQWQHVEPAEQGRLKRAIVVDALRRIAHMPERVVADGVRSVPEGAYRTSLRLAVEDGRAVYRRRRAHDGVPVDACLVAHPRLAELVVAGRFGEAREVVLRVSATGERLVLARPTAAGVDVPGDVAVAGADRPSAARRVAVTEEVAGRRWRVSAASFFQSGPAAAELVVQAVGEAVGPAPGTVVDAYAGVGVLGGSLDAARLVAVEQQAAAARDARWNLRDLPAEVVVEEVARWDAAAVGPVDAVVADPARSGLGRSAVAALTRAEVPRLVLVSCDPASLARDTGLLGAAGYDLDAVQVLDLFPNTFHVETVATFLRR